MTKLEKVLAEQLSKMTSIDFGAIIAAAAEGATVQVETPQKVEPAPRSGANSNAGVWAKREATKVEALCPKAEAPKAEAPRAEVPRAEAPRAEAPRAEVPRAEAQRAEAQRAEAQKREARKREAQKTEASAPKVEAPVDKPAEKSTDKPASGNVIAAFLEGDKAARGAIVSLATLAQLREINEAAKIGFDLSKYDDDSLAVARNKVMRWVNKQ